MNKIADKETFKPNASNLYEFHRNGVDPTNLPPIDFTVPPMTPEEEHTASLWAKVNRIHEVLNQQDPKKILEQVASILN